MINSRRFITAPAILLIAVTTVGLAAQPGSAGLREGFNRPPDDCRPMMRWWWFGPAVTPAGIERELRLMKEGGIGGFEVQPVYPVTLDDGARGIRNLPFLSPGFLEALRFTSAKSRELGLRMDLTLGSGWPFGGPQVSVDQAACRLRLDRVKVPDISHRVAVPDVSAGEKLIAAFVGGRMMEATAIRDGVLQLPADAQRPAEVWFFISSRTGQMVKRAAIGAEGFVLDHYDRSALDHYLATVGEPLLRSLGADPPYAVFCDSLEAYGGDWTGDFLDQFRRRRGYDLLPRLPALAAGSGPDSAALRYDWGRTLTELLEERFLAPLRDWAKAHRTLLRIQGYGIPPATISSNALADLSEGEGHQWKRLSSSRWASSANHLFGRAVTSSETWTWLHSPVFRATPLDLKAEADRHFLQGINQLIGHGWPYTAEGADYPGWRFYAAGVFNEKNPWWIAMPDLSAYLQRLSFLLRQGRPANDVAVYLPNADTWAHFALGQANLFQALSERIGASVVARILESGYGLDFVDDRVLEQDGKVERGAFAIGSNRYRVVILPGVETLPVPTVRRLAEFAAGGGVLVATRRLPVTAPGLMATEPEKAEVRETIRRLFEGPTAPARFLEDEERLGAALNASLPPDVTFSPAAPDVGFTHRSAASQEFYFLANTGNVPQSLTASFRIGNLQPEWWNPMTGSAQPAEVVDRAGGRVTIRLELEPYASRVVAFGPGAKQAGAAAPPMEALAAFDLSTGWQVAFGEKGTPTKLDRLQSWTEDDNTRYFSGLATYEKTFVVPEAFLRNGVQVTLDLGEARPAAPEGPGSARVQRMQALLDAPVRETAAVFVNGRRAGSVWCPPYSIAVTPHLKPGENQLRIIVGNLAINHMAGRPLPDYRLLNLRHGVRFEPQDMEGMKPVPAGLLGPVRLTAMAPAVARQ